MSQCKVNKQNREQVVAEHIDRIIDGMNVEELMEYARSALEADYKHYSDTELEWEIIDSWDEFPWGEFDYIDE